MSGINVLITLVSIPIFFFIVKSLRLKKRELIILYALSIICFFTYFIPVYRYLESKREFIFKSIDSRDNILCQFSDLNNDLNNTLGELEEYKKSNFLASDTALIIQFQNDINNLLDSLDIIKKDVFKKDQSFTLSVLINDIFKTDDLELQNIFKTIDTKNYGIQINRELEERKYLGDKFKQSISRYFIFEQFKLFWILCLTLSVATCINLGLTVRREKKENNLYEHEASRRP